MSFEQSCDEDLSQLRALSSGDQQLVRGIASDARNLVRLRIPHDSKRRAQLDGVLWNGVLCQFLVLDSANHFELGIVSIVDANMVDGCSRLRVLPNYDFLPDAALIDGIRRFIEYVFQTWPLENLYFDCIAEDEVLEIVRMTSRRGGISNWMQQGRLKEYELIDGCYKDRLIFALTRARWKPLSSASVDAVAEPLDQIAADIVGAGGMPDCSQR